MEGPWRRFAVVAAAAGVAGAYAWWTAGLRPFTWPALVAVGVAGVVTIIVGTRSRRPCESRSDSSGSVLPWAVLCALLAAWELAAYFQQPRSDHPTLSSLADQVLDWRPAQALAFLAWLAVGLDLSRR